MNNRKNLVRKHGETLTTIFSVAVFAHNEAPRLVDTIESILVAGEGAQFEVVILANGCSDRTVVVSQKLASNYSNVHVVEIHLADKANAWNQYVHEISVRRPFCSAHLHVFVDGDVQVSSASFQAFSSALAQCPLANAFGALPTSGRDRKAWSQRMIANGTLAGGLYALSENFLERIRQRCICIPRGLIGEDWAVSLFAQTDLNPLLFSTPSTSRIVFVLDAGFSFRSLSFWCPKDYLAYLRRLWRYSLRGVQYEMFLGWLAHHNPEELPIEVEQLYLLGVPPSRLKWVGITSFLRLLAVQKIRFSRTVLS